MQTTHQTIGSSKKHMTAQLVSVHPLTPYMCVPDQLVDATNTGFVPHPAAIVKENMASHANQLLNVKN